MKPKIPPPPTPADIHNATIEICKREIEKLFETRKPSLTAIKRKLGELRK